MKLKRENILRDALYCCSTECTKTESFQSIEGKNPSQVYGQGIVNGAVSAFMSTGMDFERALALVIRHMPDTFDNACMPEAWKKR